MWITISHACPIMHCILLVHCLSHTVSKLWKLSIATPAIRYFPQLYLKNVLLWWQCLTRHKCNWLLHVSLLCLSDILLNGSLLLLMHSSSQQNNKKFIWKSHVCAIPVRHSSTISHLPQEGVAFDAHFHFLVSFNVFDAQRQERRDDDGTYQIRLRNHLTLFFVRLCRLVIHIPQSITEYEESWLVTYTKKS